MNKNILKIAGILVAVSFNANAADSYYLKAGLMGTKLEDSEVESELLGKLGDVGYDTGFGANAALGMRLNSNVALEAEFLHQESDVNNVNGTPISGSFEANAVMANAVIDFLPGESISPYVGGGVGMANLTDGDYDDDVFAYQAFAGLNFKVGEKAAIYTGYRYFATEDLEVDYNDGVFEKTTFPYASHNVEAGFKLNF